MRIDSNLNSLTGMLGSKLERTPTATSTIQDSKSDKAQFSDAGSNIASLTTHSLSIEEMRSNRVDELRKAIVDGTYSANPHAIANAMFDELF